MKITHLCSLMLVATHFVHTFARPADKPFVQDLSNQTDFAKHIHIDTDSLHMLKSDLEATRKVLVEIRDAQSPAVLSRATSSLASIVKELSYLTGAVVLTTAAGFLTIRLQNDLFNHLNSMPKDEARVLFLSGVIVGSAVSYILIKIIFDKLLSTTNPTPALVKEALPQIENIISKIDLELRQIDKILMTSKTTSA